MSLLYNILLAVHILTAIIAIGPLFTTNIVYKNASSLKEIKYAQLFSRKISKMIDVGFGLQFVTGLLMGIMNPTLFQMLWYNLSLVLFLFTGMYYSTVVKPKTKALVNKVNINNDVMISEEYKRLVKNVNSYERIGKVFVLVIIMLMIFKP
ncbi:DUF2269 family protein [Bacillus sp. JCM 19034]|uniref:DUF2269 family protein n=1 Tax=Bacillus sp. JCM 19034 TaxID=1481928 RepID=UPI00078110AF|nr:DUF2269 family protein [Bacillus sp. JCM 19034]